MFMRLLRVNTEYVAPFVGAWIEITISKSEARLYTSLRSSERGLKFSDRFPELCHVGSLRSSERGLK